MTKNKLPKWNLSEIYLNFKDPKIEKDITKLGKTPSSNFLTRLSHSGSYILLTCMTIIGPSWLITNNNILLMSTIVATIIICDVVVTVHDAIHYPSQHPIIQNQKWFKFLDNHHFIHHIDHLINHHMNHHHHLNIHFHYYHLNHRHLLHHHYHHHHHNHLVYHPNHNHHHS